jgi:acyl-CoA reductase-like NAD-dependent aldehyde dehydrogenase
VTGKMVDKIFPDEIPNWVRGQESPALSRESFAKINPADGKLLCRAARSRAEDVRTAVEAAKGAQPAWADLPAVKRGEV